MQINGIGQLHGPQPISAPHQNNAAKPAQSTSRFDSVDQLDISPEASLISQVHDAPDIRADRVAAIREQIANGMYETDEKLDIVLDRLLDELA